MVLKFYLIYIILFLLLLYIRVTEQAFETVSIFWKEAETTQQTLL